MTHSNLSMRTRLATLALSVVVLFFSAALGAQPASSALSGSIVDAQGKALVNALVTVKNGAKVVQTAHTDGNGQYNVGGLPAGTYTVEASTTGFETKYRNSVELAAGQTQSVTLTLNVSTVLDEVTVNASIDSLAAAAAPSGGFLEERSAQSLVSNTYIENFTAPIADYGEIVQTVPGTFTTSANGVGLGQSKTYFRGFPDGDYNVDFDGIPFYDTNTPTHHSWSFFPAQWIGGVDSDRSPGSASTIGPTPFGGSIHLLSKPMTTEMDLRGTASVGTWNTKLYDAAFNTGNFGIFGGAAKSNIFVDWHHMSSDGYQSYNYNLRSAGSLIYQYQFSPKTVLTGFSGVVRLNSNGPNISSNRCQLYGTSPTSAYSCTQATLFVNGATTSTAVPYAHTGSGIKFLLTNNSDPASWFNQQYNSYQVPTDFEYVGLKSELGKGWYVDIKPYTYNYDNGELYSNATAITDNATVATIPGSYLASTVAPGAKGYNPVPYYDGIAVAPCNVGVTSSGITALPCGIDKYNSYRKYGESFLLTQTSSVGVFRTGLWYEWAKTNRHQYPSDPANGWADQPLPKFNETFWTNSYQPYAEYEWHATPKFNITGGGKLAYYSIDVLHHADDGATVGELTCASTTAACSATIEDKGSFTAFLPSLDFNYRFQPNLSAYVQVAKGSIVPPSATFDYLQTSNTSTLPTLATPPQQQKSTTYQTGMVYKGQRVTLDADIYHVNFQAGYTGVTDISGDTNNGDTIYYLTPSSTTQGVEFESTVVLTPGLNLYLNGTAGNAYYHGEMNANLNIANGTPVYQDAPSGLWVANTPTDTEMQGLTYDSHGFDLGIFNHRVGEQRIDASAKVNGLSNAYHNMGLIPVFSTVDSYINYTVRNHSIFDQTKIRLSATNLLDSHSIQSLTLAGKPVPATIPGTVCGTAVCSDMFNATAPAINGNDNPTPMAGRSFAISVTFGIAPRERK